MTTATANTLQDAPQSLPETRPPVPKIELSPTPLRDWPATTWPKFSTPSVGLEGIPEDVRWELAAAVRAGVWPLVLAGEFVEPLWRLVAALFCAWPAGEGEPLWINAEDLPGADAVAIAAHSGAVFIGNVPERVEAGTHLETLNRADEMKLKNSRHAQVLQQDAEKERGSEASHERISSKLQAILSRRFGKPTIVHALCTPCDHRFGRQWAVLQYTQYGQALSLIGDGTQARVEDRRTLAMGRPDRAY